MFTLRSQLQLFCVLLEREWLVYRKRLFGLFVSFLGIRVITASFQEGYIRPLMYFAQIDRRVLMVLSGFLIKRFVLRGFDFAYAYFNDMQHQRNIWFQRASMPASLIYASRLFFATTATYSLLVFFIPLMKVYLQSHLDLSHTNWLLYAGIFYLIAYMVTSFAFLCMGAVTSQRGTIIMRLRVSDVLLLFGAFHVTWLAMYTAHPFWGYASLCSPFTYASESLRHTLFTGGDLLPLWFAVGGLLLWSTIFTLAGMRLFKRRVPR